MIEKEKSNMEINYKKLFLILGIFLLILGLVSTISGVNGPKTKEITINNMTKGGLKLAIKNIPSGGTIYLKAGVYSGKNNVNLTINKNINIVGKTKGKIIFDGKEKTNIFTIKKNSKVSLKNLNLINGQINGNGGAITNLGYLTISNSKFSNNKANNYGGAIYNNGNNSLTIKNSKFMNNFGFTGGAIYNNGVLTVSNSNFTNNTGNNVDGAIKNSGNLKTSDSNFMKSLADKSGGAIYNSGNLIIKSSNFKNNYVISNGGAIFNIGTLTISNSGFKSNSGRYGGAILNSGNTSIKNSNFTKNTASTSGGAICHFVNTLTISNSIFKKNIANNVYYAIFNSDGVIKQRNVTISPGENTTVKNKTKNKTTIIISSISGSYGQIISLKAKLKSKGKKLKDKTINFYVNGVKIGQNKTDKNGIAKYKYKIKKVKKYRITAKFDGDSLYNQTESSIIFNSTKAKVKMSLKNKLVKNKIYVKLTALGKGLINKILKFFVKGKYIGKAKTKSQGISLFKYNPKKKEKGKLLKINVVFPGDKKYKKITKSVKIRF